MIRCIVNKSKFIGVFYNAFEFYLYMLHFILEDLAVSNGGDLSAVQCTFVSSWYWSMKLSEE